MLFSNRSLLTMLHGLVLSGGAMMLLVVALFALRAMATTAIAGAGTRQSRTVTWIAVAAAVMLWGAVISGTYVIFPLYRATPPEGVTSLAAYPRALLTSSPDTLWLHAFAMEIKEHMPWIAAMLATAAAVVTWRHRDTLLSDAALRRMTGTLLAIALALVSFIALLGVFVNKVAPLW